MHITSMLRTGRNLANRQATNIKICFFLKNFFKNLYNYYANLLLNAGDATPPVGILRQTYWSAAIVISSFIHHTEDIIHISMKIISILLSILVLNIHHDLKNVPICIEAPGRLKFLLNDILGKSADIKSKLLVRKHCYFFFLLIHILESC